MQENCNLLITGPLIIFIKFTREYFDFHSIRSEIEWKRDIFDPLSVLPAKCIETDIFSNFMVKLQRNSELPDEWFAVQNSQLFM